MTLLELLRQIRWIETRMLTTEGIPLKMFGKDCEVLLKLCCDNGNYWVEVRPSIGLNEQVAIIMQMFEDGNSGSIAMEVANQIKQRTIDKACEWLYDWNKEQVEKHGSKAELSIREFTISVSGFRKAMED